MSKPLPFWKTKRLDDMTKAEWESLCDGCGRCCLHKLRDDETDALSFTEVACHLLDLHSCRCQDYAHRKAIVPDCVGLTAEELRRIDWLPPTCGYRRVAEGKDLAWWHPLVSGDPETVHTAGISARGRAISERCAGTLESHIVDWPGRAPRPANPAKRPINRSIPTSDSAPTSHPTPTRHLTATDRSTSTHHPTATDRSTKEKP